MKYKHSDWYQGLLFAEQVSKDGYRIKEFHPVDNYFSWEYNGIEVGHFGENDWIDGVLAYYKHMAYMTDDCFKEFKMERLTSPFAQVIEDNFWELVLK